MKKTRYSCSELTKLGVLEQLMEPQCLQLGLVEVAVELVQMVPEHKSSVVVVEPVAVVDNCYAAGPVSAGESSFAEPVVVDENSSVEADSFVVVVVWHNSAVDIVLLVADTELAALAVVDNELEVVGIEPVVDNELEVDNSVVDSFVVVVENIHKIERHSFDRHMNHHSLVESMSCHKMNRMS